MCLCICAYERLDVRALMYLCDCVFVCMRLCACVRMYVCAFVCAFVTMSVCALVS